MTRNSIHQTCVALENIGILLLSCSGLGKLLPALRLIKAGGAGIRSFHYLDRVKCFLSAISTRRARLIVWHTLAGANIDVVGPADKSDPGQSGDKL